MRDRSQDTHHARGRAVSAGALCAIFGSFGFFVFATPLASIAGAQNNAQASNSGTTTTAAPAGPAAAAGAAAKQPDWMVAAGGHMQFDVISVKQDTQDVVAQAVRSNIPLGPMDSFVPTGGLLSAANIPLGQYLVFAYKLTPAQVQAMQTQLPKWANSNRYDIEAKASGNPTKDQFRLMMQALLADRFKLAMHFESKDTSVLALVLDKPGKMGPHLRLHPDDATPCSSAPSPSTNGNGPATIEGGYPEQCGVLSLMQSNTPGRLKVGGRNVPLAMLASMLGSQPIVNINKPVVDKTDIAGKVDFIMEFSPEVPAGADFSADPNGPTFMEALKDDLGMKLQTTNSAVESIVIDHIEEPSEN